MAANLLPHSRFSPFAYQEHPLPVPPAPLTHLIRRSSPAKQFYSSVFDWQFQPQEHHSERYPPELIAFFHAPDKTKSPGGAISKIENEAWLSKQKYTTEDRGNAFMYLFVSDLTEFMKVRHITIQSVFSADAGLYQTRAEDYQARSLIQFLVLAESGSSWRKEVVGD
jgi:hypothetical protein